MILTKKKARVQPRALLIGEAPGRPGAKGARSWDRLAKLIGISVDDLWRYVRLQNLLKSWPGKQGKGDCFPIEAAARAAKRVRFTTPMVIFAGQRVCDAFGLMNMRRYWCDFFVAVRNGKYISGIAIPHPSGINRWYNSRANRMKLRRSLRAFLRIV